MTTLARLFVLTLALAAVGAVRHLPVVPVVTPLAAAEQPDILFISIDTLRADRMDVYGGGHANSPALQAFAMDAVVFDRAFGQATWTLPGHATLLTGLYPSRHLVFEDHSTIRTGLPYLPALLKAQGYRTVGWASHIRFDGYGFERGFDEFKVASGGPRSPTPEPRVQDGLAWLRPRMARVDKRPVFAFLHLYDVHGYSYQPEVADLLDAAGGLTVSQLSPANLERVRQAYDARLRQVDGALDTLFQQMRAQGTYTPSLIIVTTDHGHAFGEEGQWGHGNVAWAVTRIPLLIKFPGQRMAGTRLPGVVEGQIDLLPTVLTEIGASIPSVDGRPLQRLLGGRSAAGNIAVTESTLAGSWQVPSYSAAVQEQDARYTWSLDERTGQVSSASSPASSEVSRRLARELEGFFRHKSSLLVTVAWPQGVVPCPITFDPVYGFSVASSTRDVRLTADGVKRTLMPTTPKAATVVQVELRPSASRFHVSTPQTGNCRPPISVRNLSAKSERWLVDGSKNSLFATIEELRGLAAKAGPSPLLWIPSNERVTPTTLTKEQLEVLRSLGYIK